MTSITPGGSTVNGVGLGQLAYIEQRTQTALIQALEGTSQEGGVNIQQLRMDAAFETGVPPASITS